MGKYIDAKKLENALNAAAAADSDNRRRAWVMAICILHDMPVTEVAPVVRCRECIHSTKPGRLTEIYGEPGTLTCHHGPCNRRNVNENDFCSYGERRNDDGTERYDCFDGE